MHCVAKCSFVVFPTILKDFCTEGKGEMLQFLLLVSRQGKVRLAKWYVTLHPKEKSKIMRDCSNISLSRNTKLSNFIEYKSDTKLVCKRYASLFFIAGIDSTENELMSLELIHHYVEVLDKYFGNVCELDLIFNFHKAYQILDECILGGEVEETSKRTILKYIHTQEALAEETDTPGGGNSLAAAVVNSVTK